MMKRIISIFGVLSAVFFSAQTSLTNTENYIYSKECLNDDCTKASEKVQYFDSFGRPYQSISIKSSPTGKDMVQHIPYDHFGRSVDNWSPVPMNTLSGAVQDSNSVKSNALAVYGDSRPFSHMVLENSPLSRPLNQITPGQEWQTHPITMGYNANTSSEVKKYTVSTTWVEGRTESALSLAGNYPANTLTKNTVTDEDGNISVEYKNKQGQIILVKKGVGTAEETDTYYVYNEYNQLVYVLPPLAANVSITSEILETLCYQYRYDKLNRLVEKKIPGKGWEYMVYDKADRLILSRDTNLKAQGKWLMTKYDQLGRTAYTGLIAGGERAAMQGQILNSVVYETRNSHGFIKNGMSVFYSNVFFNDIETVLSISYYDTYPSYGFNPPLPASVYGKAILTDTMSADLNTKGLPILSLVKNIENDNWTKNYIWYDIKRRAVGTYTINHLGGYARTESDIDFSGLAKQTKIYHKRLSTDPEKVITQNYEYDAQGRLLVQKHKVDSNAEEVLTQNKYNELSQLAQKKVGGTNIAEPLQTLDYAYNIRGQITGLNNPQKLNGKLFGYEIKYTSPIDAEKRYNGNITEVDWSSQSDNVLKRYDYSYDALNRLTLAHYREPLSSVPDNNFYNEEAAYDLNGNINKLWRNNKNSSGTAEMIDNLTYSYLGNSLQSVSDGTKNPSGYPGGGNFISYDDNGNMTSHPDQAIDNIQYNFLNLPNVVKQKGAYTYVYRADGTKLIKSGDSSTTDYLDGFQYITSSTNPGVANLKFIPTSEGYYDFENNKYIYQYKDHLGNIRLSYAVNGSGAEIIEENNYYPFGLKHQDNSTTGNSSYTYKFSGKELQENGQYDFGARFYMPDIARWGTIDPLAETSRRWSPYTYAYNSPVMFIDPDGRQNISALRWNFDSNTSILGSNWFGDSYNFGGLDGSKKSFWNSSDNGGSGSPGGLFLESDMYKSALNYLGYEPDFSQFDFSQFMGPGPMGIGRSAHSAMATYFKTTIGLQKNWFPEQTQVMWKWDLKLRPDLHYMDSGINSVWELKPMSNFVDSSLSLKGKYQAQVYADALTMLKKEKFFVGSSQGAPVPPINGRIATDPLTGYQFSYTVPIGTDGMIYYNCLNCQDRQRDPVRQTQTNPQTANQMGTGLAVALLILNIAIRLIPN